MAWQKVQSLLFITTNNFQHIYDYTLDKLCRHKKGNCCQKLSIRWRQPRPMKGSRYFPLNSCTQCQCLSCNNNSDNNIDNNDNNNDNDNNNGNNKSTTILLGMEIQMKKLDKSMSVHYCLIMVQVHTWYRYRHIHVRLWITDIKEHFPPRMHFESSHHAICRLSPPCLRKIPPDPFFTFSFTGKPLQTRKCGTINGWFWTNANTQMKMQEYKSRHANAELANS